MERRIVADRVTIAGQWLQVDKMPVDDCPNCGERYYDGPFIVALEHAMRESAAA